MKIINNRKIFYAISGILILASILSLATWGLKPGLDFTGGSLLNISFEGALPTPEQIQSALAEQGFTDASVRLAGSNSYIIRTKEINQGQKNTIVSALGATEKEFNSIGPVLGIEAVRKSYIAIILVLLAIILFITFAFRKVSKPISSWVYGIVAILALLHDVIIPTGVFSILGYLRGFEVDTLFVTALLVVLGFSVHDTIVVFDRVRENLKNENDRGGKKPFEQIVGESVSQTFVRSINTSLTTLLAIVALYIFGPETTRHFALTMGMGIIVGTYSSIFIGSPLLVTINKWRSNKK
ncbi:MAG: protein translocase subunit SecF [Patescibacteria group bacterium]